MLCEKSIEGDFCVQQSPRASSGVTMGQDLERPFNKTARR